MIKNLKDMVFDKPTRPENIKDDDIKERIFNKRIDNYITRTDYYAELKFKLWEVIWYQCSKALQTKLESLGSFEEMVQNNNCARLLREIKRLMYQYDRKDYKPITIYYAKLNALICHQGRNETINNYYTRLKGAIDV